MDMIFVNASLELDNDKSFNDLFELIESHTPKKFVLNKRCSSMYYARSKASSRSDIDLEFWGLSDSTQEDFIDIFSKVYWVKYCKSKLIYYTPPSYRMLNRSNIGDPDDYERYYQGFEVLREIEKNNETES